LWKGKYEKGVLWQKDLRNGDNTLSDKIMPILSELRHNFEALYGERLVQMLLYGSRARGDATPLSDIDVLVVLHGPVSPSEEIARTVEQVAAISLRYNVVIACVFVSEEQFIKERSPLLINVHSEGIAI
jgi:uncharacterized protein